MLIIFEKKRLIEGGKKENKRGRKKQKEEKKGRKNKERKFILVFIGMRILTLIIL